MVQMPQTSVSVIGSGIGGLSVAIRLAISGFDVTVYEKNDRPGGKLSILEEQGYRFDTGPSLFTQPANIEELFALAGEPIEAYFSYHPVDISCRYFFENGKTINAYTKSADFARQMQDITGERAEAIEQYLRNSEKVYDRVGNIFLNYSLHKGSTWLNKRIIPALKQTGFDYIFRTLDQFNKSRLRTPEAVQIFNRFATYNGSNPYQAPGMLSLIPHLEQNQGTFYPRGGMISIIDALYKLALKKGVCFKFGVKVESILTENNAVKSIVVNGEEILSDLVVSNVDVYYTYLHLLKDKMRAAKVLKRERSSSALIFYWGIAKEFPSLHLHNIFFSKDYPAEFRHLFELKKMFSDPTVYINITSKLEPEHAPPGKENWFVMLNAPAGSEIFTEEMIQHSRLNILAKLKRMLGVDLEPLIETEETLTPGDIESKTDSYMGSLYGTSSNSKWAAFLRHPNFSTGIRGLYFTGGSVHPGGGIPLCMKSAKIVSELILEAGSKR
jgi:phytoene desaturase